MYIKNHNIEDNIKKIRTINSRIRRGVKSTPLKKLVNRAGLGGYITKSGYISKSKKVYLDPDFDRMLGLYEHQETQLKDFGEHLYNLRASINSLIHNYIDDSDYYQSMRKNDDMNDIKGFKDDILELIRDNNKEYEKYTKEDLDLIDKYLTQSFKAKRLLDV